MVFCTNCGEKNKEDRETCTNCGELLKRINKKPISYSYEPRQNNKGNKWNIRIVLLFFVVVILYSYFRINNGIDNNTPINQSETNLEDIINIEITVLSNYSDGSSYYIVCEIINNDDDNLKYIDIDVNYYDSDNNMIGTTDWIFYKTWRYIMQNGIKHYFRVSHRIDPHNYTISVNAERTYQEPYQSYEIIELYSYIDEDWLTITGLMNNTGNKNHKFELVAIVFDENNNIIDFREIYTDNLLPNQTEPFEIRSNFKWMRGIYDYFKLFVN